jgi:hypothetical protein
MQSEMTDFWTTADEIPALPGAYVLAINLSESVVVSICGNRQHPWLLAAICIVVRPRDPVALRRASRDICDMARPSGGMSTA